MNLFFAALIYAGALLAANLSIAAVPFAYLAPMATFNAFMLIGLDLTMRDVMHARLRPGQMLALIVATSCLTYLLNPAAAGVAAASAVAFLAASLVDWGVFTYTRGSWSRRVNASNVAGAVIDSLLFCLLAPFPFILAMALGQIVAKVAGGYVWALILRRRFAA